MLTMNSILSLLYIHIKGTPIRISIFTPVFIFAVMYCDFSVYTLILIFSAFIHEMGHIIMLKSCGAVIFDISAYPFGAVIRSDISKLPYKKEAACAVAGILFNIMYALISLFIFMFSNDAFSYFSIFCNLMLAGVNILPIKTLDGGRALESLLFAKLSYDKACMITDAVSYLSLFILACLSLLLIQYTGSNFSLIIFCVYLFICVIIKREM